MPHPELSRYAAVSRRTALTGALGAALLALASCSNDDSALAGTGSPSNASTSAAPSSGASVGSSASPSASSSASSSSAKTSLPASATLSTSFTFQAAASGGPSRNPYVAVWIENAAGELVKTVALWHEDRGGQDRWLSEMKAFSALSAADAETVSSATRQPGTYRVVWDGSTLQGARALAGSYRLLIEAAREHGPYELIQHDLDLGAKSASFDLTPSGELTKASATYAL